MPNAPSRARIPARVQWAADLLDVHPNARVLEIGCGPGHAVTLVAARLTGTGHLTAIDRSATMVARARARNAAVVATGRVVIARQTLEQAAAVGGAFEEIFAVNVNCFWTAPAASVAALRRLGRPGAAVCLVYEPPSRARRQQLATLLPAALQDAGITVTDLPEPADSRSHLLAVRARLPGTGSSRAI
jgi:SAM-dependent methyltransferase